MHERDFNMNLTRDVKNETILQLEEFEKMLIKIQSEDNAITLVDKIKKTQLVTLKLINKVFIIVIIGDSKYC